MTPVYLCIVAALAMELSPGLGILLLILALCTRTEQRKEATADDCGDEDPDADRHRS